MNIPSTVAKLGGPLAAGAGITLLAPIITPLAGRVVKPVVKTTIKGGLIAFGAVKDVGGRVRAAAASTIETLEDLTAEVKEELEDSKAQSKPKVKKTSAKAKAA
jgi:hypothetical protein